MSKQPKADATLRNWLGDEVEGLPPAELVMELDALFAAGPGEAAIERAQQALAQRLEDQLPPTIYYGVIEDAPFSPIYVATGLHGLVSVDFGVTQEEFLTNVRKHTGGEARRSPEQVARCSREIREYLEGDRTDLDIEVDLSAVTPFQRSVLEEATRVPRGQVATYGEIAQRIGQPKASRAVGQALRRNPVPIVVPCHRVVSSDGTLGGYGGKLGSRRKIELLRLEGVVFA